MLWSYMTVLHSFISISINLQIDTSDCFTSSQNSRCSSSKPSTSASRFAPSTTIWGEAFTSRFLLSQVVCSREEPAMVPMASTTLCVTSWTKAKRENPVKYSKQTSENYVCKKSAQLQCEKWCSLKHSEGVLNSKTNHLQFPLVLLALQIGVL